MTAALGPHVLVACDTRPSSPALYDAAMEGIVRAGGDARGLGVAPTPALSSEVPARRAHAGVMITASHNPAEDNGLKVLGPDGGKLDGDQLARLEALLDAPPPPAPGGTAETILSGHLPRVRALLPPGAWLTGRHVVLDAAAGAYTTPAAHLLRDLGAQVTELRGTTINDRCGATHPGWLVREVRALRADVGIALDGDGDRGLLVAADGTLLDGDALLWLLRRPPLLVGTVMTNSGLERALAREGLRLVRTAVGDANVARGMRETGATIGGEPSGHVLVSGAIPTADGLLSTLLALHPGPDTLLARAAGWTPDASILRAVRVTADTPALEGLAPAIAAAEARGIRVVVRRSGTEPVIRVLTEGPDAGEAEAAADTLVALLQGPA